MTAPVAISNRNDGKSALDRQTFPMGYLLDQIAHFSFQFALLGQCSIRLLIKKRQIHSLKVDFA